MEKYQDADLEKGFETIEDPYFEEELTSLFDTDDDLFDSHVSEESEYDYEPEGAFLD